MDVIAALRAHGDAGATVVDLLYGDAAADVSKALTEFSAVSKVSERTQNRIATASNLVGLGAGIAATPTAMRDVRNAYRKRKGLKEVEGASLVERAAKAKLKPLRTAGKVLSKPKTAAAVALGAAGVNAALQVGNVGGDVVTNRVLARTSKQTEKKVAKSEEFEALVEFSKTDDDKRQVFGWASVTSVGGVPVKDLQDDEIDLEEIEKAAYSYVHASRKGGNMHQRTQDDEPQHVSDLIESLVVTPEKKKILGLPEDTPEGWWVGFQVNDDNTWDQVKKQELVGFSIHGKGRRV